MTARRSVHHLAATVCAVPVLALLAGCGAQPAAAPAAAAVTDAGTLGCPLPDGPVVVAVSNRSGAPAPSVSPAVSAVLAKAVDSGASVALVDTDGTPTIKVRGTMDATAANAQAAAKKHDVLIAQLHGGTRSVTADSVEADPLGALDVAAREVHGNAKRGTVVLVDSGLQTTGALRYQSPGMLLASGADLVTQLRSRRSLPDLRGITVVLSGIGDTAPPQPPLDIASRARLVEQWQAMVEAAGAACVVADSSPSTSPSAAGLPRVTTVPVPVPVVPTFSTAAPLALREDSVGFEDDSDRLRDPAAARDHLRAIAVRLRSRDHRVTLTGTTATYGTEAGRRRLSLQRARAVKRLLVDLGVPASHVRCEGVGVHHPSHVDDRDRDGNLVPERAARNRAVFLTVVR